MDKLPQIRQWMNSCYAEWMIKVIDIKRYTSYIVWNKEQYQEKIEQVFELQFEDGVTESPMVYLRKEIKHQFNNNGGKVKW